MLSPQTRDDTTGKTMRFLLLRPQGLTAAGLAKEDPVEFEAAIHAQGFHATKARNCIAAAKHCAATGDVPRTLDGFLALGGVGPKIAHLAMGICWDNPTGIAVDTHVHRIAQRLGWVKAGTSATATSEALTWLFPKELWGEVNPTLVGFGQLVCDAKAPRCTVCPVGAAGLCPSSRAGKGKGKGTKNLPDIEDSLSTENSDSAM
jgi:endonuclease-3